MRTYRTLALVATFFKIIGWLTVIITVLSACGLLVVGVGGGLALPGIVGQSIPIAGLASGVLGEAIFSALVLIVGLVYGALEIASAELIELFIDLSTNSQRTVQLLERLVSAPLQPRVALPPPPPQPAPAPPPPPAPAPQA
jgi:hypothetical protein